MFSKIAILCICIAVASALLVPTGYNFGYSIDGPNDGNSREESRDENGNVKGHYTLRDADGRQRKVSYTAGADGFKANIESNEPSVLSKSSANVMVNGAELPIPEPSVSGSNIEGFSPELSAPSERLVPTGYKFGYNIEGPSEGQAREESSEGGRVRGSYMIRDSEGRSRRVSYIADEQGFRAMIDTNEHGTANKNPADTTINSPFTVPASVEHLPVPKVEQPIAPVYTLSNLYTSSGPSSEAVIVQALPLSHVPTYEAPKLQAPEAVYTSKSHSTINFERTIEHAPVVSEKLAPTISESPNVKVASFERKIEHTLPSKSL